MSWNKSMRPFLCVIALLALSTAIFSGAFQSIEVNARSATPAVVFSNTAPITINDLDTASPYPSTIAVAGLTGTVTKVTVTLNGLAHTFPDDVGVLVVSPSGAKVRLMTDAGGGTDISGVNLTFDDAAANSLPDTAAITSGTYKPTQGTNTGAFNLHPTDFPAPAPASPYSLLLSSFNTGSPNGTWSLYVTDDTDGDIGSISGGWSLDITAGPSGPVNDAPVDLNGDGRTDYVVIRSASTAPSSQVTWYTSFSNGFPTSTTDWGIRSDFFVPADYDGDGRDDFAVWRPGVQGTFYIVQSGSSTMRISDLGTTGDDPTIVADYTNDGKDDVAVFRGGAAPGAQARWFYQTQGSPSFATIDWGQFGDVPAPGDYDGDNRADFVVQRPDSNGVNGRFHKRLTTGSFSSELFGFANDSVVPGDYDDDGRTDVAVVRVTGGFYVWDFEPSATAGTTVVRDTWGVAATDLIAPGDYDGDGRTDYGVWREATPGIFFVMTVGTRIQTSRPWGQIGDFPVANYQEHF
ncbi:hypothetical protein BH18ACI3_BH18ACI3_03610 [soil metagenome]